MATQVASAYVSLMPSMDGFASKVVSEFGTLGNKAGQSLGEGVSSGAGSSSAVASSALEGVKSAVVAVGTAAVAAGAAAGAAMGALTASALGAYADYEQLVGGVDTLFGESSSKLQEYAADAYKTCGISANQYMTQATSFAASLVSSCGGDTAKAVEYANTAMGDMSDNINKMGSNMEDVQNAYQGFAKQNYTMLDNLKLGYGGTKEEMERLIQDANELGAAQGKSADLTIESYADVVEAIHRVQENMGITGTTSLEAATTISGSIAMMKASWQNWITELGKDDADMGKATSELFNSFTTAANNVIPRISQIVGTIISSLPPLIAEYAPQVQQALFSVFQTALSNLSELTGIDLSFLTSGCSYLGDVLSQVAEIGKVAFSKLIAQLPSLMSMLQNLTSAILPLLMSVFQTLQPIISNIATQVFPLLVSAAASLVNMFSALVSALTPIVSALLPYFQVIITTIINVLSGLLVVLEGVCTYLTGVFSGDWQKAWSGIRQIFQGIIQVIASIAQGYLSKLQALFQSALTIMSQAWQNTWNSVASYFSNFLAGIISVAQSGISTVLNAFFSLKDNIINFFSNADSWLYNSGRAILEGLGQGIQSAISSVVSIAEGAVSTIRDLFPFSPAKKGPFSGHGYTTYSGRALMSDFAKGAVSVAPSAQRTISKALSSITDTPTLGINAKTSVSALTSNIKASDYASARGNNSNVIINLEGATLNDDSQMQSVALEFMQELLRVNKMRKAGA